jgi:interleukin-like EMT inducer protein
MTWRAHLAVGLALLALVTVYTWPLARSPVELPIDDTDSRLFTWVMLRVFDNLIHRPDLLLHGNAFYPVGNSLTFAEPLLGPAVVAGPLFAATGNAVLTYKATLLLFWALAAWAMYATTWWLTRDHGAALIATLVFTLAPPRHEYWVEFQMVIAFGIPLAVYGLVRYLETQRPRYLVGFLVAFWLQSASVWYYAVILGTGLATLVVQYGLLRWRGWRLRTLVGAALGGAVFALALAPVAWPFFVTRRELDFERGLHDVDASRYADLLTYVMTRGTWLAWMGRIETPAEVSLCVGVVALALAATGLLWLRQRPAVRGRAERALAVAVWIGLGLAVLSLLPGRAVRIGPLRSPFSVAVLVVIGLALARHAVEGWRRWREGTGDRRLGEREWVALLLVMAAIAFLLSLGPEVHLAGRPLGSGLYAWLHPYLVPLRAIRGAVRFGLLVAYALALLAGFGMKWLLTRLPARGRALATAALALLLLAEYANFPLDFEAAPVRPRPVDGPLRAAPEDAVVLEWPANVPMADVDAMFRSIAHGKRVVNGFAGFVPGYLADLSGVLTARDPSFPATEAEAALRRIYGLRYLVVRREEPGMADWGPAWEAVRQAPPAYLRFQGRYGPDDLYEVLPAPESGRRFERWTSYEFLVGHRIAHISLEPLVGDAALEQWVDLSLNDRAVRRLPLVGPTTAAVPLPPPSRRAAPNVLALSYGYRRPSTALDAAYRIGETGALSPADLRVRSAGQPYGESASIDVNGQELAANDRGYNLVAFDPGGRVLGSEVFDTFAERDAAARLAAWVAQLPEGTLVAGAVRDEASGLLTEDAVRALRTLGVSGDLRGRFRESHAFVGRKGAPAATAVEALGPRAVELTIGRPFTGPALRLVTLVLEPDTHRAR